MIPHHIYYQLAIVRLLWLCVMRHYVWPNECTGGEQRPSKPLPPPRQRSSDPQPFPGLTRKPPVPPVNRPTSTAPSRPVARHPA